MDFITDASGHFLAGVTLSFADRYYSKSAGRHSTNRIEDKKKQVVALNYIIEANSNPDKEALKSREYLEAMVSAKSFFRGKGIEPEKGILGYAKGAIESVRSYSERINHLPWNKKLGTAFAMEFTLDAMAMVSQIAFGLGNGLTALAKTSYQGLALFAGMQTGKGLIYVKDAMTRSKDEKYLDSMTKELTSDGKLLEIVKNYSPTVAVEVPKTPAQAVEGQSSSDKPESADALKAMGKRIGQQTVEIAGRVRGGLDSAVEAVKERLNRNAEARRAEEEEKKKRYNSMLDKNR